MSEKEIEIKMADGVCDAVLYEGDGKKPGEKQAISYAAERRLSVPALCRIGGP